MEIWPYPYNIGRDAYLGIVESTRTKRDELGEYNTDRGVLGSGTSGSYSFKIYGASASARQTVYNAFIAVSSNTESWSISVDSSKATANVNQFVNRGTDPVSYDLLRNIETRAIQDRHGKLVHYDFAELRGVNGTEINLLLTSSGAPPTLYYAYFTGARNLQYVDFTKIQENYLDPGLVVQRSLYGQVSKQRLPSARRKWQTNYEVFIHPDSPITFQTWFSFLQSRLQSDRFLFAEDFNRYPWRVYPAIVTNTEESIRYVTQTKDVYSFPLQIEEI